jgi:signal transduction histidine kinase
VSRPSDRASERVLVLTPTGRDGAMVRERLCAEGLDCQVCADMHALLDGVTEGAGVAVVAQEALNQTGAEALVATLDAQEPWSDLPLILLTFAVSKRMPYAHPAIAFFERANVILLQRPLRLYLFLSAIRSTIRARRRQYEMRALHRDLQRAVELSEMFVSILGHDLRTPLGAIRNSAEVILRSAEDARSLRPAGRILSSSDRMARMIEQLLDFARARRQGGIVVQPQRANLEEIVRPVVQELEDANPATRIEITATGDLSGTWDVDRLGRVVSNLASNAVKHGTQGQRVTLELEGTDAATVRIRISNSGAIAAELIPRLFEPFKRTAPAKTGERGLGLGLFIAREIVEAHGGTIEVQTTGDDTTVFKVSLPRHTSPREAHPL